MNPTHDETAQLLHELADQWPQLLPDGPLADKAELLRHLANEELDRAQYDEWVRKKVATARADNRPALSIADAKKRLRLRLETLAHV